MCRHEIPLDYNIHLHRQNKMNGEQCNVRQTKVNVTYIHTYIHTGHNKITFHLLKLHVV